MMESDPVLGNLIQFKLWLLLLLLFPSLFFLPLFHPSSSYLSLPFSPRFPLCPPSSFFLSLPSLPFFFSVRVRVLLCSPGWPVEICSPGWLSSFLSLHTSQDFRPAPLRLFKIVKLLSSSSSQSSEK